MPTAATDWQITEGQVTALPDRTRLLSTEASGALADIYNATKSDSAQE